MKKRFLGIVMALCMAVYFLPAMAFAASFPANPIKVDLNGADVDNDDYKIDSAHSRIILRKKDVSYELTGTTDKKISIWGSNNSADIDQAFYIRLNNATINGGIVVENSPVKLVLDVPSGTINTISSVSANDLTIQGAGTLKSNYVSVTQQTSYMPSALHITDTTIQVQCRKNRSCEWNGECVLSGNANVTYTGGGVYAPLQVGVKSSVSHSLKLQDNAKLYCLQDDPNAPASASVSGLEIFGATTTLLMEGNSYLEAEGKASSGKYAGYGLVTSADVTLKGNASVKASAYDVAVCVGGSLTVEGGKITADSTGSNGIYADGQISVSKGAEIEANGYFPGLMSSSDLNISDSKITATSTADAAIWSRSSLQIKNSLVKAESPENTIGIGARDTITVSGSWIETTGDEAFGDSISDSILFNGNAGKVIGNPSIPYDATVTKDMSLDIPENTSLTVTEGKTFTNNGDIQVDGTFTNDGGTVICTSHTGDEPTCVKKSVCKICREEYGDLNPELHENLKHVEAKAATTTAEGNIEYWYCEDCGKYFSNADLTKVITKEDTVIAKVKEDPKKPGTNQTTNKPTTKKATAKKAAVTGDTASWSLWIALFLMSGILTGSVLIKKKRA